MPVASASAFEALASRWGPKCISRPKSWKMRCPAKTAVESFQGCFCCCRASEEQGLTLLSFHLLSLFSEWDPLEGTIQGGDGWAWAWGADTRTQPFFENLQGKRADSIRKLMKFVCDVTGEDVEQLVQQSMAIRSPPNLRCKICCESCFSPCLASSPLNSPSGAQMTAPKGL